MARTDRRWLHLLLSLGLARGVMASGDKPDDTGPVEGDTDCEDEDPTPLGRGH